MNEATKIADTKLATSTKAAIKEHFPYAVTLGDLKQCISDDPKALDCFTPRTVDIIMNLLDFNDYDTPAVKQDTEPDAYMTDDAKYAYTVHAQIVLGAKMVEDGLYQMAKGFKIMRDEKLYKELGYDTFEKYCEVETGMNRRNVYKYITIAEKIPEDFVSSKAQIGKEKLLLLAALDEEQRGEIAENTDLENVTVKELKRQIDELTGKNKELETDLENSELINKQYQSEIEDLTGDNTDLEEERDKLLVELKEARSEAREVIMTDPKESQEYQKLVREKRELEEKLHKDWGDLNTEEFDRRIAEISQKFSNDAVRQIAADRQASAELLRDRTEAMQARIDELTDKLKELEGRPITGYFLPASIEDYSGICGLLKGTKYEKIMYAAKLIKM